MDGSSGRGKSGKSYGMHLVQDGKPLVGGGLALPGYIHHCHFWQSLKEVGKCIWR